MENGLWNGQLLIASEIAKIYETEKEVRKASGRKELRCPDSDCQHPLLRYCHGEIKDAFFAHLNNECCDYADFDRENTQIMKTVRKIVYEHFKANGYQVRPEVKVLDHHYTHLLFDMVGGNTIALEIGTQHLSANRMENLTDEYRQKGIEVKWIVIGNTEITLHEDQTYFLKRYLLNESKNKDLLVISWNGYEIAQYKVDPNQYEYNGRLVASDNYPATYAEFAPLGALRFDGTELSLIGFAERYDIWLKKKKSAFAKRVVQLEEEASQRMEGIHQQAVEKNRLYRERQMLLKKAEYLSSSNSSIVGTHILSGLPQQEVSYEQLKQEVIPMIAQQEIPARDSTGKRWIKCEKCGRIDTEANFVSYGGIHHVNLGTCNDCSGSRRPSKR